MILLHTQTIVVHPVSTSYLEHANKEHKL